MYTASTSVQASIDPAGVAELPPVPDLVAAVAAAHPERIALRKGNACLAYGELERRAQALARRLLASGTLPGSVVAVRLERSFDQIVAILAAMKAGCAYLAMDPADPDARALAILKDSGAAAIVTRHIPEGDLAGVRLVPVEAAPTGEANRVTLPVVTSDDLAYVVYTSGSTGTPNGVEITHGNLSNFVQWMTDEFGHGPKHCISHILGLSFDAAAAEIWPTLTTGATLLLVDEDIRTSPHLLHQWILAHRVTIALLPAAIAEVALSLEWPRQAALTGMVVGGDALRVYPRPGLPFEVTNHYGPSECTVTATCGRVPPCPPGEERGLPTIGRPVRNVVIHILDEDAQPVPDGEVGEIWIGGAGVGRGYRHRPELTARKFRPDPFANHPQARMYATGDLGRRLPSGEIAFLGRRDHQVKIRGVRIEVDEIAACLQRHEGVASAFVQVHEDPRAGRQLVAYFVPAGAAPPDTATLRTFLARSLPASYLPSYFVALRQIPLTRHGKVDRTRLPAPAPAEVADDDRALTPVEEQVIAIAERILGFGGVSRGDDFFAIGAHSLLATRLVMECHETFGIDLALRDFLEAPTIERLAALIERRIAMRIDGMDDEEVRALLGADAL